MKLTHEYYLSRLGGRDKRRAPLFVEREDALRQDVHHPSTGEKARREACVLVVTFKPAVEDAWQTDLDSHTDFDGLAVICRNLPSQIRHRWMKMNRSFTSVRFRICSARRGGQYQTAKQVAAQGELGFGGV